MAAIQRRHEKFFAFFMTLEALLAAFRHALRPAHSFALHTIVFLPLFLVIATGARPGLSEEFWSEYRGPNGQGISKATGLPTEWSDQKNVKWKRPLHGKGWSSPVVWKNQVCKRLSPRAQSSLK